MRPQGGGKGVVQRQGEEEEDRSPGGEGGRFWKERTL